MRNLLTAFLLVAGLALAVPALAATGSYSIHSGVFQGSAQVGQARMAGTIPVARNVHRYINRRYYSSHVARRRNDPYANLNQ